MAKEIESSTQGTEAEGGGRGRGGSRGGDRGNRRESRSKLYDEEVITIKRVDKVVSGGRRSGFTALVILGNGKGKVGFANGKAKQVPNAIEKAVRQAEKRMRHYPLTKHGTIPHPVEGKFGATKVRLLPACEGTGVIAGRSVRAVLAKLGVHNVLSKKFGSRNPLNVVRATFAALDQLLSQEQYQVLRGVQL